MTTRIFPVLLLRNQDLVKSFKFDSHQYLGDPENIIRIFNEKLVDEIVLFDITHDCGVDFDFLSNLVSEAFIPVTFGGNITTVAEVKRAFSMGIERIALLTEKFVGSKFVKEVVEEFGGSSVCCVIDVGERSKYSTPTYRLEDRIAWCCDQGVSEIIIQSIEKDGTRLGLDIELIDVVSQYQPKVSIVLGGGMADANELYNPALNGLGGIAASSLFVFAPNTKSVLINNPFADYRDLVDDGYL